MKPHVLAAHNILNTIRRQFGVQHVFREIDATHFRHLSQKFYLNCENRLRKMNFRIVADIEDVTVRSSTPDPRTFLRIMSNPESKISADIYHAKPVFPWPLFMVFMRMPSKIYEFQSHFSDDALIETSIVPPTVANSYPDKIRKQFHPGKPIEELYEIHKKTTDDYLSSHRGVYLVPTDSFQALLDHNKKTFEMTKTHLEKIGWVTKEYIYRQVRGNKSLADSVYSEIQNILAGEKPVN